MFYFKGMADITAMARKAVSSPNSDRIPLVAIRSLIQMVLYLSLGGDRLNKAESILYHATGASPIRR